jgi:hypothetical protein
MSLHMFFEFGIGIMTEQATHNHFLILDKSYCAKRVYTYTVQIGTQVLRRSDIYCANHVASRHLYFCVGVYS